MALSELEVWQALAGIAATGAVAAGAYVFQRLVAQLDATADKLAAISTVTAAHDERIKALERIF